MASKTPKSFFPSFAKVGFVASLVSNLLTHASAGTPPEAPPFSEYVEVTVQVADPTTARPTCGQPSFFNVFKVRAVLGDFDTTPAGLTSANGALFCHNNFRSLHVNEDVTWRDGTKRFEVSREGPLCCDNPFGPSRPQDAQRTAAAFSPVLQVPLERTWRGKTFQVAGEAHFVKDQNPRNLHAIFAGGLFVDSRSTAPARATKHNFKDKWLSKTDRVCEDTDNKGEVKAALRGKFVRAKAWFIDGVKGMARIFFSKSRFVDTSKSKVVDRLFLPYTVQITGKGEDEKVTTSGLTIIKLPPGESKQDQKSAVRCVMDFHDFSQPPSVTDCQRKLKSDDEGKHAIAFGYFRKSWSLKYSHGCKWIPTLDITKEQKNSSNFVVMVLNHLSAIDDTSGCQFGPFGGRTTSGGFTMHVRTQRNLGGKMNFISLRQSRSGRESAESDAAEDGVKDFLNSKLSLSVLNKTL